MWSLLKLLIFPAEFASRDGVIPSLFSTSDHWILKPSFPLGPFVVTGNHDPQGWLLTQDCGLWQLSYILGECESMGSETALRVIQEWLRISSCDSSWFAGNFCGLWENDLILFHLHCFFKFSELVLPTDMLMPWRACWGRVSTFFWRIPIISLDGSPKD